MCFILLRLIFAVCTWYFTWLPIAWSCERIRQVLLCLKFFIWHVTEIALKRFALRYIRFPLVKPWIGWQMPSLPFFSELQILDLCNFHNFSVSFSLTSLITVYTFSCCSDTFFLDVMHYSVSVSQKVNPCRFSLSLVTAFL